MKWKLSAIAGVVALATIQVHACFDPLSIFSIGIVFSKGETIRTENVGRYGDDAISFIKVCEKGSGSTGQPLLVGSIAGKPADQVTIDSVWLSLNTLFLNVRYGGGCRVHSFDLYTDGSVTDTPQTARLYLAHDAQGDNCKALVSETLMFNIAELSDKEDVELMLYAPGQSVPYTPAPVWNKVHADGQICSYKMRSAYSNSSMAYIGKYIGYSGTDASSWYQLLVIFDSAQAVPAQEEKVAALKAEINRLEGMKVLSLSEPQIASLDAQLLAQPAAQYWTAEDTVLSFNMWFTNDGINGTRGVYGAKGGCGAGVDYELPSGTLTAAAVTTPHSMVSDWGSVGSMRIVSHNGVLTVDFAPVRGPARLVITSLDGRIAATAPLSAGAAHASFDRVKIRSLTRGCYIASLHANGRVLQSSRIALLR